MTYFRRCLTLLGCALAAQGTAVEETPHNMLRGLQAPSAATGETGVCSFCHTPAGGTAATPDWNRSATDQLSAFATLGLSGNGGDARLGSVSLVCLGCHDGTQAMDVGGRSRAATGAVGSTADPRQRPALLLAHYDHPVGMPYGGGASTVLGVPGVDKPGRGRREFYPPERDEVNNTPVWWVETGGMGRQKTDIQLYTRIDPLTNVEMPFVECATCHDPHGNRSMLLRIEGEHGQLCTACHNL